MDERFILWAGAGLLLRSQDYNWTVSRDCEVQNIHENGLPSLISLPSLIVLWRHRLSSSACCRVDGMSTHMVKAGKSELAPILTHHSIWVLDNGNFLFYGRMSPLHQRLGTAYLNKHHARSLRTTIWFWHWLINFNMSSSKLCNCWAGWSLQIIICRFSKVFNADGDDILFLS